MVVDRWHAQILHSERVKKKKQYEKLKEMWTGENYRGFGCREGVRRRKKRGRTGGEGETRDTDRG